MKKRSDHKRATTSERIYSWMVGCYPSPFRESHGQEMIQVFRAQGAEAIAQSGKWGLLNLWTRLLIDFVWTCPKEHVFALPGLPCRTWEDALRKPVWVYPSLLATAVILLTIVGTFLLPREYKSAAEISVTTRSVDDNKPPEFDPYFHPTQLRVIQSKASLYPVIEKYNLAEVYQKRDKLDSLPTIQETYALLCESIIVSHLMNTELIEIAVFDTDRVLAKDLANDIAASYRKIATKPSKRSSVTGEQSFIARSVLVINPAEEALRHSRPNTKLNIVAGGLLAGLLGWLAAVILRLVKRRRVPCPSPQAA